MDIDDFRGIITAVTLLAFVGLCIFAWSRHRKATYDASAQLPLEEDQYITQDMSNIKRENT
jgi:cytochrome c oxidase cbb3-type subunit 4